MSADTPVASLSQDERIMAALSHATALLPFMGVIAPIVIWVTQKDKSQYVAFQALQAMAYQLNDFRLVCRHGLLYEFLLRFVLRHSSYPIV